MLKRSRDEEQQLALTTEELVKLVELKNRKSSLLKQLEDLDTEIHVLQSKKEDAELARRQSEQHQQMQQMEPFLAKMLTMSNHLEQLCAYTKELSSKVSSLEKQKNELCDTSKISPSPGNITGEVNITSPLNNITSPANITSPVSSNNNCSLHPVLITNTLQRRCMELEEFTRELSNLQLVLDCTNKNLTDYKTLLKLKKQLD